MIRKYTFGTPLPTDAVVRSVPAEQGSLPYFTLSKGEDGSLTFSLTLSPEEVLFGLGQGVRGIDKRGHRYESWNSDVFNHTEERPSLYGSHNFLVFFSPDRLFGVYLDDPGKITWDLGYTARDQAVITVESGSLTCTSLRRIPFPPLPGLSAASPAAAISPRAGPSAISRAAGATPVRRRCAPLPMSTGSAISPWTPSAWTLTTWWTSKTSPGTPRPSRT